jgi:hypothetical protein
MTWGPWGVFPSIIFPSDIVTLQQQLTAAVAGVDQTVTGCTSLDANTQASWASFKAAVQAYTALTPEAIPLGSNTMATTGGNYNQGLSYLKELAAWTQLLQGKGCTSTAPAPALPPTPADPTAAIKWIAIGIGAVATAYVVAEVVQFIPRPEPRKLRA